MKLIEATDQAGRVGEIIGWVIAAAIICMIIYDTLVGVGVFRM